jgi:hypothetical protein
MDNFENEPMNAPIFRRSHKAYCIYCKCITNVVNTNMRKNRICEFCKEKRMSCKIINRNCLKYILKKRHKKFIPLVTMTSLDYINKENIDCSHISEMISNYL